MSFVVYVPAEERFYREKNTRTRPNIDVTRRRPRRGQAGARNKSNLITAVTSRLLDGCVQLRRLMAKTTMIGVDLQQTNGQMIARMTLLFAPHVPRCFA